MSDFYEMVKNRISQLDDSNPIKKICTPDLKKYLENVAKNSHIDAKLVKQWVGNTSYICEKILTETNHDYKRMFESLFWVRLQGILVEVYDLYKLYNNQFFKDKIPEGHILINLINVSNLTIKMRELFSREELILIEYLRHTNCHVQQSDYRITLNEKKGKIKQKKKIKVLNEELHVDEIDHVLTVLMKKYSARQDLMAEDFAKRSKVVLNSLWEEFKILEKEMN